MIKLPLLPTCSMKGTLLPVLIYCAGIAGSLSQPAHPLQPNIVFVVADDMGAWALGKGGGPNSYTPVLDKMAGAGISLRNCFANGAVCSPSRAALISGRYPSETGSQTSFPRTLPAACRWNFLHSPVFCRPAATTPRWSESGTSENTRMHICPGKGATADLRAFLMEECNLCRPKS